MLPTSTSGMFMRPLVPVPSVRYPTTSSSLEVKRVRVGELITIGELADRSGVAPSALRFYEERGLLSAKRSEGRQRRYKRDTIRRVAFILAAQQVGLTLKDISDALAQLPNRRTPNRKDWGRIADGWRP